MSIHRVAAVLACLIVSRFLMAQESGSSPEAVTNWTAAPYWSPVGDRKNPEELLPEAGELGIAPMGALPSPPLPLTAVTPCRIVDTRLANGPFGGPALVANATRTFILPAGPCAGIPSDASAYSLNFTLIGSPGTFQNAFLTAWATGDSQPVVSTLNFNANQLESNAAIVPAGTSGSINVFVNAPGHLLIDINGYYKGIAIVNTLNALSGNVTLAAGTNISITPSGQMLTIAATGGGGSGWSLTGNAGTTPGTNFVGTTDSQPLQVRVNGQRVFLLEPAGFDLAPNVVGGHFDNGTTAGVYGAAIGGGGSTKAGNRVTDHYGTVAGGRNNRAGDSAGTIDDRLYATVAGGALNVASAFGAAVLGGFFNVASGQYATMSGGSENLAAGAHSTVAGGFDNEVTAAGVAGSGAAIGGGSGNRVGGMNATVPGGLANEALGFASFAAGRKANAIHNGSFVWGDDTDTDVSSTNVNQFIARASGGIWLGTTSSPSFDIGTDFLRTSTGAHLTIGGAWTNSSDFDRKENFEPVNRHEVLAHLAALPIMRWTYKAEECAVRHMGPTGQDFAAAFGLGSDDKSIATVDADGVALAAIQALYEIVKEKEGEIETLKTRLTKLEGELD
jgi:hypothetical protein